MRIAVPIVLSLLLFAPAPGASEAEDPAVAVLSRFGPVLASIDRILADPQASPPERRALIERELDAWIDYSTLAVAALGPRAEAFSAAELVAFANEFERFFQHFYVSRISLRTEAAREAVEASYDPQTGGVSVRVPGAASMGGLFSLRRASPASVDAVFRFRQRYGDWRIVGLAIGGVDVTRFFRQQFESLLRTDTPEQLITRLREHNQRLEAQNPL